MKQQINIRLDPGHRAGLDALAAHWNATTSDTLRLLIDQGLASEGLADQTATELVARLTENYGPAANVEVATNGGATPDGATVAIDGVEPVDARAVLLVGVEGRDELRIEDPNDSGSIVVATMATGLPGELAWTGTIADLASMVPGGSK